VTSDVVLGFESVYIDIGSHELSAGTLRAIDLAPDVSQPGAPAACSSQLVGTGIFTVLGGLCAIFRCNLPVMAALCAIFRCNPAVVAALGAIFRCNPAVVDGLYAAVRSISEPRGAPGTFVCRVLTVARRAIPCGSVVITCRVVTRFGLSVTQLGRVVTLLRSLHGAPPAHSCQLVGPEIFPVLSGLCAISRCNLPVVGGLGAVVRSVCAP